MIKLNSITYGVGDKILFNALSFTLNSKKYGLVGHNGVGKSTLAKLLSNQISPDSGKIITHTTVLHLEQSADRPNQSLAQFLADIWESTGGISKYALKLIENLNLEQSLKNLSGGEWMKAQLVRLLSKSGGFLILDEPTNNLDREAKKELISFIKNYDQGMLIISHDRELLEEVDEILELSNQGLSVYGGNYSFYFEQKNKEKEINEKKVEQLTLQTKKIKQQNIEKLQRQEKRMRTGEKSAPDSGLPKILLGARKRNAQVSLGKLVVNDQSALNEAQKNMKQAHEALKQDPFIRLDFEGAQVPAGKNLIVLDQVNFIFTNSRKPLWLRPISFTIKGQDRMHIMGSNGAGKSTLIKLILNKAEPGQHIGEIKTNTKNICYLDQNYSLLDHQKTVLDNISDESRFNLTELRNELAFYGFTADKVFQTVDSLSGGEKLKASLAKMFLGLNIPELIILDEPTNNLDLQGLALLEQALNKFHGSLVIVSHDQSFVESIRPNQTINLSQL